MKRKLREHRLQQQLSQNELADLSGISLRTVQRIESGMSSGSPFVIRALCKTLQIEPDDLITDKGLHPDGIKPAETMAGTDPTKGIYDVRLKYINFSAVSVLFFPFLNLVFPTVLYFVFKKSLSHSRDKEAALKILSFQILWSFATLTMMIFIPVLDHYVFKVGDVSEIPLFVWCYLIQAILLIAIMLNTAGNINRERGILTFVPNIL
ncbi:transcriptional regulator with XRE-family HTH domain [Algoriphagus sp. 4150]|uniref:helix-turn-helix domain-containing protein n=1 Tax=Algoriphagus sp. 4150 TaxID=2817756 RepID=UPI00286429B2|nr:helix-turn-helix domain-containing protein [Algoriphagus sp. 4150]MDR7132784.1 transcriptional regulator with XRE-family HTH domain [Algoriphagus sp. 4150]